MVFSSLTFLYIFLPAALLLYYIRPGIKWRNGILLITSLVFYSWGEPVYIALLVITSLVNWMLSLAVGAAGPGTTGAKLFTALSVATTLASLGFFKYADFLIQNINAVLGTQINGMDLPLPIGISFYSFQILTYVVDVYRNQADPQRSYWRFLMYVVSFHQLIAGPIVRYQDIAEQIQGRKVTIEDFSRGIDRFVVGLGKKVIFANACGAVCARLLEGDITRLTTGGAWLGAVFFTLQIYFDFSGYSDMAIGLGHMYGFRYKENFNYPYISGSASEFWRRWHMSLGSFFRDYVYIPLGGNRKRLYFNLLVVWALTGLWHGASWNFVLWGLYFFVLTSVERLFLNRVLDRLPRFIHHIYLLLAVVLGWTLFYFTDMTALAGCLGTMFGANGGPFLGLEAQSLLTGNLILLILAGVCATPLPAFLWRKITASAKTEGMGQVWVVARALFNAAVLLLCTAMLVGESYNPFLYFRF